VNSVGNSSGAYPYSHNQSYYNSGNTNSGANSALLAPGYIPQTQHPANLPRGKGPQIFGEYSTASPLPYELVDPSFYVRSKSFFYEGKVFSVIMNETAGTTATASHRATDYNTSMSFVKYQDNMVYTNVRRFVVVRQKREFCLACPIYTYSGRATTKPGVQASEHGIAYSWGSQPTLLLGEFGITKPSLTVVMAEGEKVLDKASRIYYGIHHPVQYNVKVKDIGHVVPGQVHLLISNWKAEDGETKQSGEVTANAEAPQGFQYRLKAEEHDGSEAYGGSEISGVDDDVQGDAETEPGQMAQLGQAFKDISIQPPLIVDSAQYASSQSAQPETSERKSTKHGKKKKR
jgi:hypothetical protein